MTKRIGMFLVFIALAGLWSSCVVAVYDYPGVDYPGVGPPVEHFQRSGGFPSGSTLSLRNFDGNIEIQGWGEERVEVYAEKLIMLPAMAKVSFWSSDWKKWAPRIEYEKSDDFVRINTQSQNREGKDTVVDYFVSVPHSVNLRDIVARDGDMVIRDVYGDVLLDLRTGNLNVDNFSGSLTAVVADGTIQATLYDLRDTDQIRMTAQRGDIILYLEADANARFEGSAPKGGVFTEFESVTPEKEGGRVSARFGSGEGASISVTALEGDIRVRTIEEVKKKR
jgi:hypothetical protein